MERQRVVVCALILALFVSLAPGSIQRIALAGQPSLGAGVEPNAMAESGGTVGGTVIHVLETPAEVAGKLSLTSISNAGMSCSVSFGNDMGGADNFGMVVYSEGRVETVIVGRMAVQWGKARSVTVENGEVKESAVYSYVVLVHDLNEAGGDDRWSMTLWGEGLMFDGVTFSGPVGVGDLVVQSE
ncbi:MAG: hypothetical protein HY328_14260 [Chloroflexi bacterium]|nr:hypothetical protein [Chloroflexota bacterium]